MNAPRPGTEKHSAEYPRLDQQPKPRMTNAQRDKLWDLCGRYNVPFREDDYYIESGTNFVLGWVGGIGHALMPKGEKTTKTSTIYICVEPNGDSHS